MTYRDPQKKRDAEHERYWNGGARDKQIAANTAKYHANKPAFQAKYATYYSSNRSRILDRQSRKKYGITLTEAIERFGSTCNICGSDTPKGKNWCIDHDHTNGRVRGLLCSNCNTGLGKLGDSIEGLERAIAYLKRSDDNG